MKKKTKEEKKGTPVFRTAKGILKLLQNKVIASLMLLGQGVLFLVSPSGDMKPTIRISAGYPTPHGESHFRAWSSNLDFVNQRTKSFLLRLF